MGRGPHPAAAARTTDEARRGRALFDSIAVRWPATVAFTIRTLQRIPSGRLRKELLLYLWRRGYAAFNRRDWELNTIAHDPLRYELTGSLGRFLPDASETYRGIEGYLEAMDLWVSAWEGLRMVLGDLQLHDAPDGRVVAVHGWSARAAHSGLELSVRLADVVTFEGGRITAQVLFTDPAQAMRFAGVDSARTAQTSSTAETSTSTNP